MPAEVLFIAVLATMGHPRSRMRQIRAFVSQNEPSAKICSNNMMLTRCCLHAPYMWHRNQLLSKIEWLKNGLGCVRWGRATLWICTIADSRMMLQERPTGAPTVAILLAAFLGGTSPNMRTNRRHEHLRINVVACKKKETCKPLVHVLLVVDTRCPPRLT